MGGARDDTRLIELTVVEVWCGYTGTHYTSFSIFLFV